MQESQECTGRIGEMFVLAANVQILNLGVYTSQVGGPNHLSCLAVGGTGGDSVARRLAQVLELQLVKGAMPAWAVRSESV